MFGIIDLILQKHDRIKLFHRQLFEISPAKIKLLNISEKTYNKLQKILADIMKLLIIVVQIMKIEKQVHIIY